MGYNWRRQHEWIGYFPNPKHKLQDLGAGDVIYCPTVDNKEHPTEKPVPVITRLIHNSTRRGDTILDPFGGIFTVGVACVQTGRRFIGIEIDAGYFEIGIRRIRNAVGIGSLFDPTKNLEPELFAPD